jgi:hypothetical protein
MFAHHHYLHGIATFLVVLALSVETYTTTTTTTTTTLKSMTTQQCRTAYRVATYQYSIVVQAIEALVHIRRLNSSIRMRVEATGLQGYY